MLLKFVRFSTQQNLCFDILVTKHGNRWRQNIFGERQITKALLLVMRKRCNKVLKRYQNRTAAINNWIKEAERGGVFTSLQGGVFRSRPMTSP